MFKKCAVVTDKNTWIHACIQAMKLMTIDSGNYGTVFKRRKPANQLVSTHQSIVHKNLS